MPALRDRLPLGAAQAARAEAHVPRARRGGRSCPLIFVVALALQSGQPNDVAVRALRARSPASRSRSVILIFGSIWLFPLITALVAGDIVAAEDHNGTLKTILTRSVDRGQIFAARCSRRSPTRSPRSSSMGDRRGRRRDPEVRASSR